jgi:hypothetical protein
VPMADGRWYWRVKRVMPGSFAKLVGRVAAKKLG